VRTSVVIQFLQLDVVVFGDDDTLISRTTIPLDSDGDNDIVATVFHKELDDVRVSEGIAECILYPKEVDRDVLDLFK